MKQQTPQPPDGQTTPGPAEYSPSKEGPLNVSESLSRSLSAATRRQSLRKNPYVSEQEAKVQEGIEKKQEMARVQGAIQNIIDN